MKYFMLLLLLTPFVFGATTIDEYSSGVIRGSMEFEVTIDHNDATPVVAESVRPNDIITIIYGKGPTGLDQKISYFFKTYINDAWRYEIMRGERNLQVAQNEAIELDYDEDSITDVFLTLKEWDGRRGNFEISAQVSIEEPEKVPEVEIPIEKPAVPEEAIDEGQDNLGLTQVEEPVVVPVNPVVEPTTPVSTSEPENTTVLWVLIGVLILAVLGAVAYTFLIDDTRTEKKHKKKK